MLMRMMRKRKDKRDSVEETGIRINFRTSIREVRMMKVMRMMKVKEVRHIHKLSRKLG